MPIHKNLVTERQIVKKDAKGIGQGHGENYIPYLRVGDFGSKGRTHRILSLDGRIHHFFSDLERDFYYMLLWKDNIKEIREQFPLDREITQKIADRAGIRHPADPKTKVKIVMTTDFLATVFDGQAEKDVAYSVKFAKELSGQRTREKQWLEKEYWAYKGVKWHLVTENSFDRVTARNIRFLMDYYQDNIVTDIPDALLPAVVEQCLRVPHAKVARNCEIVDEIFGLQTGKTLSALYYYAAHKVVPMRLDAVWNTWKTDEIVDLEQLNRAWEEGIYDAARAVGSR